MHKNAVFKAENRLSTASEALPIIQSATDFRVIEKAWVALITALNTVHTTLEQGAKATPQSRQWYGGIKKDRRDDPLLQYLHQARNADEHGIAPILKQEPGSVSVGAIGEDVHVDYLGPDGKGGMELRLTPMNGKLPTVVIRQPSARLIAVTDERYGTTFAPPMEHLGSALTEGSPEEVAKLGMVYHERLVADAKSRVI